MTYNATNISVYAPGFKALERDPALYDSIGVQITAGNPGSYVTESQDYRGATIDSRILDAAYEAHVNEGPVSERQMANVRTVAPERFIFLPANQTRTTTNSEQKTPLHRLIEQCSRS